MTSTSNNSDDHDSDEEIIRNSLNILSFYNNETDEQVCQTLHNPLLTPSKFQLSLQYSISTTTSTTVSIPQGDSLDTCSICLQNFQRERRMAIH